MATQKIVSFNPQNNINGKSHRKENNFSREYTLIVFDKEKNEFTTPLIIREYNTNSRSYACVWFNHNNTYASGSDFAGGYGYHRPSQAICDALISCGFKFEHYFGGYGESAITTAILAIAQFIGAEHTHINIAHG
jgi:hypothetical protein